jgi:transposase
MNINSYEVLVRTENRARLFLVKQCWTKRSRFCIRCRAKKVYRLAGKRYRCKACGYTFSDFTARFIGQLNITAKQWLWLVKLFELEVSSLRIARELELSYPTVLKATHLIRLAIITQLEDFAEFRGEIELDESYFGGRRRGKRGRGAVGKVPVFGLLERNGRVKVEVVRDVSSESLLDLTVKTVRRGSLVYTDQFKGYDALVLCGYRHLRVNHSKGQRQRWSRGQVYINGLEGFWSYAKERLLKHHGVSPERFPLYLKEMEFRYNHREEKLFPLLVQYLCDLVPNL